MSFCQDEFLTNLICHQHITCSISITNCVQKERISHELSKENRKFSESQTMWRSNLSFTLLLLSTITTTTTAKILYANTSSELTSALKKAKPGDVVTLLPVDYVGDFVLPDHTDKDNATSNDATTLLGTQSEDFQRHSTIISSTGTGISITAHRRPWNVKSLVIQSNDTGVKIRGNNHVIQSVVIRASKVAAVIKGDNIVLNSTVISNGEKGVILGGNDNVVKSVALNGTIEVDILIRVDRIDTSECLFQDFPNLGLSSKLEVQGPRSGAFLHKC